MSIILIAFISASVAAAVAAAMTVVVIRLYDRQGCPMQNITIEKKIDINPDAGEIKILWLGDTGSGSEEQKQVALASARTCEQKGCDLAFLLGDNFIQNGVNGVDDPQFQSKFEQIYPQQIPFYAILGNHDLTGNWRAQIHYTNQSERWMMPDVNYQLNAGPVFIQAINSTCTIRSIWTIFKKTEKPWRVLCCHRPFVSNGRHPGMLWLEKLLVRRSGARLVISGHNAGLEHLKHYEIDQIVSGGGGTELPDFVDQQSPFSLFHAHSLGYVWTSFTPRSATAIFHDQNGEEIYRFVREI